jgi:hypothetical protein
VRIVTEVITPFDGRVVTFRHTFSGKHHSLPQVSTSTLRFHDTDTLRDFLKIAGLKIEQQFGDFDSQPLSSTSPEIVTLAMHSHP